MDPLSRHIKDYKKLGAEEYKNKHNYAALLIGIVERQRELTGFETMKKRRSEIGTDPTNPFNLADLTRVVTNIGRAPNCHVVINRGDVSKSQVTVAIMIGGAYMIDSKSKNGTFVGNVIYDAETGLYFPARCQLKSANNGEEVYRINVKKPISELEPVDLQRITWECIGRADEKDSNGKIIKKGVEPKKVILKSGTVFYLSSRANNAVYLSIEDKIAMLERESQKQ